MLSSSYFTLTSLEHQKQNFDKCRRHLQILKSEIASLPAEEVSRTVA